MHWTALLERRYFPARARVVDDVPCVSCGYNLRQARAAGPCPECGRPVTDSLWALAKPDEVANALRSIGKSYLGLGALILVPFGLAGQTGLLWVAVGVVVATGIVRAVGAAELRFRGAIDHLPVIGARVRLLLPLALLDVVLAVAWSATLIVAQSRTTASGWGEALAGIALSAWLVTTFTAAAVAGWMGAALAAMLGYETVARELRSQGQLIVGGAGLAIVVSVVGLICLSLLGAQVGGMVMSVALGLLALLWLGALLLTFTGLLHLANATEGEREALDHLVDAKRTHHESRRPDKEELPPIKLESDQGPRHQSR